MADTTIYTKAGCPYCRATMEEYRRQGLPFEETVLHPGSETLALVKSRYGANKVPVIVRDGKLIQVGDRNGNG